MNKEIRSGKGNRRLKMNKKQDFTLVELLVVIAIITILASMLLPALNKARDKAYSATCQSNLKQVCAAQSMYMGDWQSYYPVWSNWAWDLTNNKYMPTPKPYFCPAATKVLTDPLTGGNNNAIHNPTSAVYYNYITYGYNYFYAGGNYINATVVPIPAKAGNFKYPARKIWLTDARGNGNNSNQIGTSVIPPNVAIANLTNVIDNIHNNSANILWIDGHISLELMALQRYQMTGAHSFFDRTSVPLY